MDENTPAQPPAPGKRGTIVTVPDVVKSLCQCERLKFHCSAKQPGPTGKFLRAQRDFTARRLTLLPGHGARARQIGPCEV